MLLNQDSTAFDLNGWVTLDNRSGATYTDAKLKLVAGDINIAREQSYICKGHDGHGGCGPGAGRGAARVLRVSPVRSASGR